MRVRLIAVLLVALATALWISPAAAQSYEDLPASGTTFTLTYPKGWKRTKIENLGGALQQVNVELKGPRNEWLILITTRVPFGQTSEVDKAELQSIRDNVVRSEIARRLVSLVDGRKPHTDFLDAMQSKTLGAYRVFFASADEPQTSAIMYGMRDNGGTIVLMLAPYRSPGERRNTMAAAEWILESMYWQK